MTAASSFDWESLITGHPVPRLKKRWLFAALRAALQAARAFNRGGLGASVLVLDQIAGDRSARQALLRLPQEDRLFLAREVGWTTRGLVRTLYGQRLCLFETLTATAALRALGLPAYTIVAYATGSGSPKTPVHAWPALDNIPVSDSRYVWQRYTELTRYPKDRKDSSCAG